MKKSVWKNLVLMAMTMCFLFGLAGCSGTVEMTLGETAVVEECVEVTPENILVSSQVFPPISSTNPLGWVLDDETKTYVSFIASIKNLSDEPLTADELWEAFSIYMKDDYVYPENAALVTEDGKKLSGSASIEAGKTETVYFITKIAKADLGEAMEVELNFKSGADLTMTIDAAKPIAVYESWSLDQEVEVEGVGTISPKSIEFAEAVEPSNPGYTYKYYAPRTDDDKLLVLTTDIENTSKSEKDAYLFFNIMAFTEEEVYLGELVADDEYAANILSGEVLAAKETRKAYGIINLPKSVAKEDLDIYIYMDGKYYQYKMK